MKFSVIIPLYNCASYVEECIESILNNDYDMDNIQIIVVNDGSTDNSLEVVSKYKDKIEIYTKVNGNWGSVINYVKNNVRLTGDYITILDSDDKLCENFFIEFDNKNNSDILISNFYKFNIKKMKRMNVIWGKTRLINNIDKCRSPVCHPLGKLYKKELFLSLNELPEHKSFLDGIVFHELLSKAVSVFYINKELSLWRFERPGNSTTMEWNKEKTTQFHFFLQSISNFGSSGAAILLSFSKIIRSSLLKYKLNIIIKDININWIPCLLRFLVILIWFCIAKKVIDKK